jgi:NTP pyrophosphatase (non-canonical NTP hydrolase)
MTDNYDFQFLDDVEVRTLRGLQEAIGRGNAVKGFHAEGLGLRAAHASAEIISKTGDEPRRVTPEQHAELEATAAAIRNYHTARLALITTEVAEAIEELRKGEPVNGTYYVVDGQKYGMLGGANLPLPEAAGAGPHKPEGVPSEVADVVIRAFDFAHEAGFDLAAIIDEKLDYNASRAHMHGKKF